MDYGAITPLPVESFQIMHDPEMMEGCGFADLGQIVNGVGGSGVALAAAAACVLLPRLCLILQLLAHVTGWQHALPPPLRPSKAHPAPAAMRCS